MPSSQTPEYWLEQATLAMAQADGAQDASARRILQEIAAGYERLAYKAAAAAQVVKDIGLVDLTC